MLSKYIPVRTYLEELVVSFCNAMAKKELEGVRFEEYLLYAEAVEAKMVRSELTLVDNRTIRNSLYNGKTVILKQSLTAPTEPLRSLHSEIFR
jgi:hypothetical protein